jgi:hypothetical protein
MSGKEPAMNLLRSFIPWIGFAVVATQADWRYSGLAGLLIAGGLLVLERRHGNGWDTMIIELSAVVFFAALSVYSFADPGSPLRDYVGALSDVWLAITAWGSIALRRPFTLGIAKTMVPPALWDDPAFRRINVVITSVWATSFTLVGAAAALLLNYAPHATIPLIVIKVFGFTVPALFTVRYTHIARTLTQKAA